MNVLYGDISCHGQGEVGIEHKQEFKLWESLAYVANMKIFWMLVLGLGKAPLYLHISAQKSLALQES